MDSSIDADGLTDETHRGLMRVADEVKPRLRGWLHAVIAPLAAAAGIVQVAFAPTTPAKFASAVFCLGTVLLFTVSASYHAGHWSPRTRVRLKRWDHANIFLLIACTYTPFSVLMLPPASARTLLTLVWCGAILGAVFQIFWVHAPRWLYVPIYLALGWAAVFWFGDFAAAGKPAVLALIVVGGLLYTVGAIVYAAKRPNPAPEWFGFHEIFHTMTIAAFLAQYVGVWLLF
jgi:hemolysin III